MWFSAPGKTRPPASRPVNERAFESFNIVQLTFKVEFRRRLRQGYLTISFLETGRPITRSDFRKWKILGDGYNASYGRHRVGVTSCLYATAHTFDVHAAIRWSGAGRRALYSALPYPATPYCFPVQRRPEPIFMKETVCGSGGRRLWGKANGSSRPTAAIRSSAAAMTPLEGTAAIAVSPRSSDHPGAFHTLPAVTPQ